MVTIEAIKNATKQVTPMRVRAGCFLLEPAVKLRSVCDQDEGKIKAGEIVHADKVDEYGEYPLTVHIAQKGWWWKIENFELA